MEAAEGRCVGVGVSLPGVVSPDGDATLVLPLGWEQVPFGAPLAEALWHAVPVGVEQDALLAAKSEFVWGAGSGLHRMLYLIARDHGVGGAVVGAGLLEGAHHPLQAGHIQVRTDGKPCECGSRGCLETYIDADAVRGVLQEIGLPQEPLAEVVRGITGSPQRERFAELVVEPLRVGLVTLVNALGPDGVVLGGGLGILAEVFFPELERAVAGTVVARVREVPLLRETASDPILRGAGLAAFGTLFRDPRECGVNQHDRTMGARL
ncbi:MAG: ROK family protein [Propionibacterium sp.]|nr:ROK family protein [Propionibacterium sp.]